MGLALQVPKRGQLARHHRIPEQACRAGTTNILADMNQFLPSKKLVAKPSDPSWRTKNAQLLIPDRPNDFLLPAK